VKDNHSQKKVSRPIKRNKVPSVMTVRIIRLNPGFVIERIMINIGLLSLAQKVTGLFL